MATSKYTIAPPSVAPLLHEYGDWDNIPDEAWDEYCAAQAYWARSRRMYAGRARAAKPAGRNRPRSRASRIRREACHERAARPRRPARPSESTSGRSARGYTGGAQSAAET